MNDIIIVGATFLMTFFACKLTSMLYGKMLQKRNTIQIRFARSIIEIAICVAACIFLANLYASAGVKTTLVQSSAVVAAILTFAAQKTLGNLISGISVVLAKPFDVGQKVKVVDHGSVLAEGIISDITIRHTVIKQYDGQSCIVPNAVMDSSVIVNTNFTENVGNFIEVEISYQSDADQAIALIEEICRKEPLCIQGSRVFIKDFSPDGVILKTTVWTVTLDDNYIACSRIRRAILKQFAENEITIPYHTVTVMQEEPHNKK